MDSLTQIVLGAACGEVVLGKKVGNKAMFWGAVGGTIPDLDVVVGHFFMTDMNALAFHRGFMHSIFFAITMPAFIGFVTYKLYNSGFYKNKIFKLFLKSLWILFSLYLFYFFNDRAGFSWSTLVFSSLGLAGVLYFEFTRFTYFDEDFESTSFKDWYWLFFLAIFTHSILDCFTAFGTQLFQPFFDYRVAWNNISVVDPLYTIPFLLCLIIASCMKRHSKSRFFWNWIGLGVSSFYMLWTVTNKIKIDHIFENSLAKQGIEYTRYTINPSILNNIYWQGVAEGDTAYYCAGYSFFDKSSYFENFTVLPKNHEFLDKYNNNKDLKILKWFSNNYYNIYKTDDSTYQINDLRYGTVLKNGTDIDDFVFKFHVKENKNNILIFQKNDKPSDKGSDEMKDMLQLLWKRVWGQKK